MADAARYPILNDDCKSHSGQVSIPVNGCQPGAPMYTNMTIPATSLVIQESPTRWGWASTVISALTTFFCCPICGLLGMMYAMLAYTDHKTRDYKRSAAKNRWAWTCGIASFVLGVIFVGAVIFAITNLTRQLHATGLTGNALEERLAERLQSLG